MIANAISEFSTNIVEIEKMKLQMAEKILESERQSREMMLENERQGRQMLLQGQLQIATVLAEALKNKGPS